ncbi:MAG: hypothetical protein IT443_03405 [Phycisphaeraceae bacterium]|nr:hypothetical protein [Phycisphaeraceae bacterium]
MRMLLRLKKLAERFPEGPSRLLTYVPFWLRLGWTYSATRRRIRKFERMDQAQQAQFVFDRVRWITQYAYAHHRFYQEFYRRQNFDPACLHGLDDLRRIPIVTKNDLRRLEVEDRSSAQRGRMKVNTGGTSGSPLEFYLDHRAWAREWAHQHVIWAKLGYRQTHNKLTFRGINLGEKHARYNVVHNEYILNTYLPTEQIAPTVWQIARQRPISFLFGYPSAIYNFACYCETGEPELGAFLRRTLKGALFASEYPAPIYRDTIERVFGIPTVSWYGHSEMAILAYERHEKYLFEPMPTYGYCETAPGEDQSQRLIGTSYYNTVSPFIRYDTGDLVEPVEVRGGLLRSFKVAEGRVGDFVIDAKGHRISLTALIFGRHHPIFGRARYIQVRQDQPGQATLLVTFGQDKRLVDLDWQKEFDLTNVDMRFDFQVLDAPVRTAAGKTPLLVKG